MKLILIDGKPLVFKSSVVELQYKGEEVGIIYNFVKILRKILLKLLEDDEGICIVVWDKGKSKYRRELYPDYKANRKMTDEDYERYKNKVVPQIQKIKEILFYLGMPQVEADDTEADDIIGVLVEKNKENFDKILVVSPDKDMYSFLRENVILYNPISEKFYDLQSFYKDFDSLSPQQYVFVKALAGDPSDNILGVEGIGIKTAVNLIKQYGTVENLFNNCEGKWKDKLIEERNKIEVYVKVLSPVLELSQLENRVGVEQSFLEMFNNYFEEVKVKEIFSELGFVSLLDIWNDWVDIFLRLNKMLASFKLERLEQEYVNCQKCTLCQYRKNVVFGEGTGCENYMIIGESPGRKEDEIGKPFIGDAGQLLMDMLEKNNLCREMFYITNAVLCFPVNAEGVKLVKRDPSDKELLACKDRLKKQIKILRPRLIILLGNYAVAQVLDFNKKDVKVSKMRGLMNSSVGKCYVTYHPASFLHNRDDGNRLMEFYNDWKEISRIIHSGV